MFRYSGTAWDGQKWRVAKSIETLGDQIMGLRGTTQSFGADGTVASKAHDQTNPNSDHTVKPKVGSGVVYAIDFHEERLSVDSVLEAIRQSKDDRVLYGIHDRRMFSSYSVTGYPAWAWRPYGGSNGHPDHGHLSVVNNLAISDDPRPWAIGDDDMVPMWTKDLDETGWRNLAREGIAAGGEAAVVDYWVVKGAQRTDAEHQAASTNMYPQLLARAARVGGAGLPDLSDYSKVGHEHNVTGKAK